MSVPPQNTSRTCPECQHAAAENQELRGIAKGMNGRMTIATGMTASELVLVDSSGWLEYITGDEKADAFGAALQGSAQVLVPTIVLYEVFKILLLRASKTAANLFLSEALRRRVVDLTDTMALAAASLSIDYKLPMADAIIYATAQAHQAELITSDAHFSGLPGVTLI